MPSGFSRAQLENMDRAELIEFVCPHRKAPNRGSPTKHTHQAV